MIDVFTALSWLQELGGSHLNNEVSRRIKELLKSAPPDRTVKALLERLCNVAQASKHPLERAEIWLNCAAISYWRRWFPQSACYAQEAIHAYDNDDPCRAVALWILGMAQWKMGQNPKAHTSWDAARTILQLHKTVWQSIPAQRDSYGQKLWQMKVDLAARPEEIISWLNQFEASSLRWSSQQVVKCVQEKIREQAYLNMYDLIQDVQEAENHSQEVYEKGEIYLQFGLALYQLGHLHSAVEFSRKAVERFYSGIRRYHKQVVARCMLGALEWQQKSSPKQAFVDWTRSMEEFEELRCWAEKDKLQEKEHWYAEHCALLKVALSECLPRQYQDLVFLVHHDPDEANRLVEWKLRQFPEDSLGKLIERAIEHVLMGGN